MNKVAQAKINANVNAEMKRMVALGNKRYNEHLKKDAELNNLIKSNKAATDKRMQAMAAHFTMELNAVKATMKKNRAHASHMLAKKTSALYSQIEHDEKAQLDTNGKLKQQTREATMAIQASLKEAKDDFAKRLTKLHSIVVKNDKKFEGKMDKLTGIVRANEVKNQKGRDQLAQIMKANKAELKAAVRDAIHKGEARMAAAEKHLTDLNEKTKAALNMKITTAIAKQAKRANDQIEGLRLSSKEARAEMKKQLLYAIRSMSQEAKENLDAAKEVAVHVFAAVNAKEAAAAKHSAAERAKIAESIKEEKESTNRQVKDAVASMHRSLLALKYETEAKIKKTNTRVDAYAAALKKEAQEVSALMASQMTSLHSKIAAQKAQATNAIKGADAASAAGFAAAMDEVEASLKAAEEDANAKFTGLEEDMADQRSHLVKELGAAVADINDKIAKQAALADSRFSKTVKDISAARKEAATEVADARQEFATDLAAVTSTIKEMDPRLTGEVQVVSGSVIEFKAQQHIVNRHVAAEINRIEKLMDARSSHSKRARGKLRKILDENKRAAAEEVEALDTLFKKKIAKIRSESADDAHSARADLAEATANMYEDMAAAQTEMIYANEGAAKAIATYSKESLAKIAASKSNFEERLDVLTNTVAANNKAVEKGFEVLTGVIRDHKAAGEADRALLKKQNMAMAADMQKKIVNAIQKGEAEAKAVAQQARAHLAAEKKSMLVEITNTVEDYADMMFKTVQGKHQKIADNYLSLKAYAASAEQKINAYIAKGKGKNLNSLGDLLTNVASMSKVTPTKQEGLSPSDTIPSIFTGMKGGGVKIDNKVTKINGLVHEYVNICNGVRARWPMGLGKYLLTKLEGSMSKKGVLQVDKVAEKAGNWVYINGHAVGLSNKLNDFESLAVRMGKYEATLAAQTAALSGKHKPGKPVPKPVYADPPEWNGQ